MDNQPRQSEEPFRFLDLPAELRNMVYGFLPVTILHHILKDPICRIPSTITVVIKSLPMQLLAVCRLIHTEARPILRKKQDALRTEPLRLIVDATSEHMLFEAKGLLANKSLLFHIGKQHEDIRSYGLAQNGPSYLQGPSFRTMSQLHDLNAFTREVAVYVKTRSPSSTILTFRQPREHQLKEFFTIMNSCSTSARRAAIRKVNNVWPGPLGFMHRGSNATGPGAVSVIRTNNYLSRENARASINAREDQFWVEDVEEDEWKRNWEEGGVFE